MKLRKIKDLTRKQKNILGLCIIIILAGISLLIWLLTQNSTTLDQNMHIENVSDINKFTITDKEKQKVTLEKQSDSLWVVNNKYEANYTLVKIILETFSDMRIREPLAKKARNNVIKDLASQGKKVEVYTKEYLIHWGFIKLLKREKLKRVYYVGAETPDEQGTYMLRKGDDEPYVVYIPNFRGYLSTRFTAFEDAWRTHEIFKYKQSEIQSIKIELPSDEKENFTLINNGKGFSFVNADGVTLHSFDTTKVVALLSSFVSMNYERIAHNIPKIEQDTIFTKQPSFIISLTNNKGKTETLKTYVKLSDPNSIAKNDKDFYQIFDINRCYALSSELKDTLIMQFFTLDNVLKPASYFMTGAPGLPYHK